MNSYVLKCALAVVVLLVGLGGLASAQAQVIYYPRVSYYAAPAPVVYPYTGVSYSFYPPSYVSYYPAYMTSYAPVAVAPAYASVTYGPFRTRVRYYNPGPYYYTPAYPYTAGYYSYYYTPGFFRY
jgi:hypothetical protein